MRMSFGLIVFGGLVIFLAVATVAVFVPALIWNPPVSAIAHDRTPLQEKGRKVFYSNGCNYCHTQYVRAEDTAMGPVAEGGDYAFDDPMILGSERTGPDLSYVGRKRSERWEIEHLKDPRQLSPNSLMPRWSFLADADLEALAAYLFSLGDQSAAARMINPPTAYVNMVDPIPYPPATPTSDGAAQGWPNWRAAGLQDGKEMYVSHCLTCHGPSGNGLGSYGGTLAVTPADFKVEPFRSMPAEQFFWHVSEGLPGTVMPTWKVSLTEEERWNVVRYVQNIFARPRMHDPDEGDVPPDYAGMTNPLPADAQTIDEGKAIFTRECSVCHGDSGRGEGIYGQVIQPGPPDLGDGSYGDFTDADYFWRISEGVPWTAMPAWKLQYNEADRWRLTYYIRTLFTQTLPRPAGIQAGDDPKAGVDFDFPDFFKTSLRFPADVSYERGKTAFVQNCAHCHGLAGDGEGWDGQYLNPKPKALRDLRRRDLTPETEAELLAKISFGIKDTAMPRWAEFLTLRQRWDDVKFVMDTFMVGKPVVDSVVGDGALPANYVTISRQLYLDEGHVISETHGAELFPTYCGTCHGDDLKGNGPGTENSLSKGPAALPMDLGLPYIFWRTWEGVPESIMPPFQWLLESEDIWDIVAYLDTRTTTAQGGGQ